MPDRRSWCIWVTTAGALAVILAGAISLLRRSPAPPGPTAPQVRGTPAEEVPWDNPATRLPSFTLRTVDHARATVSINGAHRGTTALELSPYALDPDPSHQVDTWPPSGTVGCASYERKGVYGIELRISERRVEGDHLLYFRMGSARASTAGAVRLRVTGSQGEAYRFVEFTPLDVPPESEFASRFARTLWFEPEDAARQP